MKLRFFCALAASALLAVNAPAHAAKNYASTNYPIVLAHGLWGWNSIAGVDHFYGVAKDLQANGAKVHTTLVSAVNSSDVRGEQLVQQLQKILAVTGARKVNIIAHSQGSQDARYAAAALPGRVASVTAVHGVVFGSRTIDALNEAKLPFVDAMAAAMGTMIDFGAGNGGLPQDTAGMLASISSAGSAAFNARFPAGVPGARCGQGSAIANGTRFYSWTGSSVNTNFFDISDAALAVLSLPFEGAPSDGVVGRCDAHLGTVIRDDYNMNHLDAVNQVAGLVGRTDPVALYRQHANRLKLAGL